MRTARLVTIFTTLAFVLAAPGLAEAGKKKKKKGDEPAEPGWHRQEGWMGDCYMPPDWSGMSSGQKRMEWQTVRDQIIQQWKGNRDDGINFDERAIETAELHLSHGSNLLVGVNGVGKTTVLDALAYCLLGAVRELNGLRLAPHELTARLDGGELASSNGVAVWWLNVRLGSIS